MSTDALDNGSTLSAEEQEILAHLIRQRAAAGSDRILAGPETGDHPVSFSQQRIWAVEQLGNGGAAYNLAVAFRVSGALDAAALQQAAGDLVARHASLRTTFHLVDHQPVQRVHASVPVAASLVDLRHLPASSRLAEARSLAQEESRRPFDLTRGPLFRLCLIAIDDFDHLLVLTMHHIVSDGWSMGVLYRELAECYRARLNRSTPALPPLPVQYPDTARWQRSYLQGERLQALVDPWRTDLGEMTTPALPLDWRRPAVPVARGGHAIRRLPPAVMQRLESIARTEGATRFMALLAGFLLLLSRYTGRPDVMVGMPIAGRNRAEVEGLIGLFVNMLPLRVELTQAMTFRMLLRLVRDKALAAYDRQDLPFDLLLDALGVERRLDRHPLFQVAFGAQDEFASTLELPGARLVPFELDSATTRFDLEAHVLDSSDGARVAFVYNVELFEPATIDRLLDSYAALIESCAHNPDARVGQAAAIGDADRRMVVETWNASTAVRRSDATLTDLVRLQTERHPGADAVVCGPDRLSYAALVARARQLARHLRRLGVGRDVRVAVCMDRSADSIVALLGILEAGAAYVPLDPAYPADRLAYMAADSRVQVAITETATAALIPASVPTVVRLDAIAADLAAEDDGPLTEVARHADDLTYVIYTSGSTGQPKGVEVVDRAVVRLLCGTNYVTLGADDTLLQLAPASFDASTFEIWGALVHGGRLVLYPERLPQIDELAALLAAERVTTLWLTASLYNAIVDQQPAALAGVRQLLIGGEALSVAHVRRGLAALPDTTIINGYGPTEGTTFTCCHPIDRARVDERTVSIPLGGPIAGTQVYVLDADMEPVAPGMVGELYIGGDGLARGYTRAAALTAARFVPDGVTGNAGARLYRTGDLVRWRHDGTIEYFGRADGQVKVRGHRIELGEIETALATHPTVRAATVVLAAGASPQLVAYVTFDGGAAGDVDALRGYLRTRLPEYMVPSAIVSLDALPLTPNGKVDRRALPAVVRPATDTRESRTLSAVEAALAEVWRSVLQVDAVGLHDNFFELGGDSILAIQIASRASRAGVRLSPNRFFEHQTIAELARVVEQSGETSDQAAVTGSLPLTPIQHWFFEQQLAAPGHYHQSVLLTSTTRLKPEDVQAALDALIEHHDGLRAGYTRLASGWSQNVAPPGIGVPLTTLDLRAESTLDQDAAILSASRALQQPFALDVPPLVRAALLDLGDRGQRLLLVLHHLVVDGVSWRILLDDLQTALDSRAGGGPIRFPLKTASYQEWAHRLQAMAAGDPEQIDRDYWHRAAAVEVPPLPVDRRVPAESDRTGDALTIAFELSPEDTDALLRQLPAASGARIGDAVLAASAIGLSGLSGARRVAIDVEGHGRDDRSGAIDVSRTVGWFTAIYPLRMELPGTGDPLAIAAAVHQQMATVPRGGIGYGVLRYLGGDTGVPASSDVSVNYLGQFDQVFESGSLLAPAAEPIAPPVADANCRRYKIEINARVAARKLSVACTFNPAAHTGPTIERFTSQVSGWLRQLAAQCRDAGRAPRFEYARLDAAQTAAVVLRYGAEHVEQIYPATPLQLGMVVHSLASPRSGAFVTQFEMTLAGEVDAAALRRAWIQVQQHHEVLRSAFVEVGGGDFRRIVLRDAPFDWEERRFVDGPDAPERYEAFLTEERVRGFDLAAAPLMRCALAACWDGVSRLVWTHHHALLDGWSVAILFEQLFNAYARARRGEIAALPAAPAYGPYAVWLAQQDGAASERFWRSALAGVDEPTQLAAGRRPDDDRTAPAASEIECSLDEAASQQLQRVAAAARVTVSTVVHAAWAVLLSRRSGAVDVVFGTAVAGRPPDVPGIERMVGLLLNGVPLRIGVDPQASLQDYLASVQMALRGVLEHAHVGLSDVHAWSGIPLNRPLFETTVAFENYAVGRELGQVAADAGVTGLRLLGHNGDALHLRVVPGPRVRVMLGYDTRRFDHQAAQEMLRQVDSLLRQMAAGAATVSELTLVTGEASTRLPDPSAAPAITWGLSVPEQIAARAQTTPLAIAVHAPDKTLTYAGFDDRSARMAALLAPFVGASPEPVIGIYGTRSADLACAIVAVLRCGAAFTILDAAYPAARLRDYLDRSGASAVVQLPAAPAAPDVFDAWLAGDAGRAVIAFDDPSLRRCSPQSACAMVDGDRLAYVAFTSGSTGKPKAILGRHASLAHYASWMAQRFGVGASDRFTMVSALAHDPLLRDVLPPLQLGATLCVPPAEVFDQPGALAAWMASARVTVANLTPAMGHLLEEGAGVGLPSLRLAFFVGEPLTRSLVTRLRARAPGVTCVNLYGATETQQALAYFVDDGHAGDVLPVGRGITGVDVLVLTGDRRLAGIGEVGDIWLRSPLLARGYKDDPVSSGARFADDVAGPGTGRAYRTGDRGCYLADGAVQMLGRDDDQIKIRGFRIEPAEVESALLQDSRVREAAVVAGTGAGGLMLVAYVAGDAPAEDLRRHLSELLPGYMMPSAIVAVDRLPRTATGKVDRRLLATGPSAVAPHAEPIAPRTETEAALVGLWSELLHAPRLGVEDSFFDLGGHSILAARLVARIRAHFDVELRISELFERPRIAALAGLIDERVATRDDEVSRLVDEIKGLSEEELRALLDEDGGMTGAAEPL